MSISRGHLLHRGSRGSPVKCLAFFPKVEERGLKGASSRYKYALSGRVTVVLGDGVG